MATTNKELKKLVQLINRIQDISSILGVAKQDDFDLPQIVVIGGQSEGKSSVLENIVGRDFLPRGAGIVTRCPLVLQLVHCLDKEYGEFGHKEKVHFENFEDIRKEIEEETKKKVKDTDGISSDPITLRIYSPNVTHLTLIDLPGMTHIAVGPQPKDIEEQIEELILKYISKENCLILAVIAANKDLATSDALKMADKVDEKRERTIGVLTKIDLMDEGTNCREVLDNKKYHLKRGYIGVVNRGQKEIDENKDIISALDKEKKFFATHSAYKDIVDRSGTSYLQKYLSQELAKHIKKTLPSLIELFSKEALYLQKELQKRESIMYKLGETKGKILIKLLNKLKAEFESRIGMTGRFKEANISSDALNKGVMIKKEMNDNYRKTINHNQYIFSDINTHIKNAIENFRGVHHGLFTPDPVFDLIIRKQIKVFREPSIVCIETVVLMLRDLLDDCCDVLSVFPNLKQTVKAMINSHLDITRVDVLAKFEHRMEMESSYMNTDHEDFMSLIKATSLAEQNAATFEVKTTTDDGKPLTTEQHTQIKNEHMEVEKVRILSESYITILKKNLQDFMPKLLMLDLIYSARKFLTVELGLSISSLNEDELLAFDPEEEKITAELQKQYEQYRKACDEIHAFLNDKGI